MPRSHLLLLSRPIVRGRVAFPLASHGRLNVTSRHVVGRLYSQIETEVYEEVTLAEGDLLVQVALTMLQPTSNRVAIHP